jgi:hypothetical protein
MTAAMHSVPMVEVHQVFGTPDDQAEADALELQGMSEGVVVTGETVECMGGHYLIGDKVGLMPLMRFASASKAGIDSSEMEGLVAMYDMLRDCIHPDDWDRFERDMTVKQAEGDDMMPVVGRVIEMLTARPTKRASASSPGPSSTTGPSTDGSSPPMPAVRRVPAGADELIPVADLGRVLAASGS